jgi:hypothetical protein
MGSTAVRTASLFAALSVAAAFPASGQSQGFEGFRSETARALREKRVEESTGSKTAQPDFTEYHFLSKADSLDWLRYRGLAMRSTGFRIIVSLQDRHVWAISDEDTLLSAPAATAKGTLTASGWDSRFKTPRGARSVLDKSADPIWQPPDWLYAETAEENGLHVRRIPDNGFIKASDGRRITVRDNLVGVVDDDGEFAAFPKNLHIIVGEDLYIPPMGTENRRVAGTLGKYKLNLGDGYMLHGTPDQNSIGSFATHGCVRLRDEDIEWLYENVPVGTKVYIY